MKESIAKDCYSLNIRREKMTCKTHEHHDHVHGANCGHTVIKHEGHVDYLHDGHLHHEHNGHYDEHALSVNETNPDGCHPVDTCHGHVHGEVAATKPYRTAITLTTSSTAVCITNTAITATTTARLKSLNKTVFQTAFNMGHL